MQNLISKAIEVKPGSGKATKQFTLSAMPYQAKGITFSLQSETRGSIDVGTPVLYRDIEVGRVTDVRLGNFADRVISTIEIESKYAYLVRENSLFWNTSGLDVSIGLSGANVKAGTLDSIVRGGITFATPEQKQLTAAAKAGQSFYLYPTPQEEWKKWRTAIPKP